MEHVIKTSRNLLPPPVKESHHLPYLGPALDAGMATFFAEEMHRGDTLHRQPRSLRAGRRPARGQHLARRGGRRHHAEAGRRVRGRHRARVRRHAGRAGGPGGRGEDRPRAAGEEPLRLHERRNRRQDHVRAARRRRACRSAGPPGSSPSARTSSATVFAIGFATRAAMSFGGIEPGDYRKILIYNKDRVFAFGLALGFVSDEWYANGAGASTTASRSSPTRPSRRSCPPASAPTSTWCPTSRTSTIVPEAIEVRGLKVTVSKVPIPVAYGPAFEGERVRGDDIYLEAGGGRTPAVELVVSARHGRGRGRQDRGHRPGDHRRRAAGASSPSPSWSRWRAARCRRTSSRSWSARSTTSSTTPRASCTSASATSPGSASASRPWTRASRLAHLGEHPARQAPPGLRHDLRQGAGQDLHRRGRRSSEMLREGPGALPAAGRADRGHDRRGHRHLLLLHALPVLRAEPRLRRHARSGPASAAPTTGSTARPPSRSTRPARTSRCTRARCSTRGTASGRASTTSSPRPRAARCRPCDAYSIMRNPMTSCGCFECIAAVLPLCNGVMTVNRDFAGDDPLRHEVHHPGRHGRRRHPSPRGSWATASTTSPARSSWPPRAASSAWSGCPRRSRRRSGSASTSARPRSAMPDLLDKIADETVGTTEEEILPFLTEKGHPALTMEPLF